MSILFDFVMFHHPIESLLVVFSPRKGGLFELMSSLCYVVSCIGTKHKFTELWDVGKGMHEEIVFCQCLGFCYYFFFIVHTCLYGFL